jgi:polyhydroxyalkanoate synthesis regulator phasin
MSQEGEYMEIDIFGFQFGKKPATKVEKQAQSIQAFTAPEVYDGTVTVEAGGFFGTVLDYATTMRDEQQSVIQYRNMSVYPELDNAIDEIVNAAIVPGTDHKPVKIDLTNCPVSDNIKNKIYKEFDTVLHLLDFNHRAYEIFRRWYIDSKVYYNLVIDKELPMEGIQEIIPIDPLKIKKIRKLKKEFDKGANGTQVQFVKDIEEFYVYTNTDKESYIMTGPQGLHLSLDSIVYVPSGLVDLNSKRVLGYLHKAIRPLNMLRQMEDALLVYRIARAPERRVFYVDVGQLPKQKAEQYMRDMMSRFRTRLVYNQDTGEIRDERKFMSVLEDYWLPRREGSRGTEISTLPGAQSLSQIEDAEYFKKKLYGALNVPLSRLTPETTGFNMGRSTEITREEIKFYKFIDRLRFQFSKLFMDTLRVQLLLKGVMTDEDWRTLKTDIKFVFNTDNYFWDLKEAEILAERLKMLSFVEPYIGKYFSTEYVKKNILKYLPEELVELEKQMATDRQRIAQEQAAVAAQQAAQAGMEQG